MSIPTKISVTELVTYVVAAVACWNSFSSPALVVTLSSQTRVQTSPTLVAWTWYSPETGQWWSTQQGNKVLDRIVIIISSARRVTVWPESDGPISVRNRDLMYTKETHRELRSGDNYPPVTNPTVRLSIFQVIEPTNLPVSEVSLHKAQAGLRDDHFHPSLGVLLSDDWD